MGRRANKAFAGDFGGARGKFGGEYQAWVAAPLLAPETGYAKINLRRHEENILLLI